MSLFWRQLSTLPPYLAGHVGLTLLALLSGILISIPLAILILRHPRYETTVLGVASLVQTVPALALLALMVPLLGGRIGWIPASVALVLYSVLPILRNALTGLRGVLRSITEAADGIGMSTGAKLLRVQLPLALPTIMAGIRTSAVSLVGMATLATPVGGDSLGYYIFMGLNTRQTPVVLFGCFWAAALALFFDLGLRQVQLRVAERRGRRAMALVVFMFSVAMATLALPGLTSQAPATRHPLERTGTLDVPPDAADRSLVRIGAKNFTEQYILAELVALHLQAAGFATEIRSGLGSKVAFDSLASSAIDVYIDYAGTLWSTVLKRTAVVPSEPMMIRVGQELLDRQGIVVLGPLGFENAYTFAMTKPRARELGVTTMEDLARVAPELAIAGDFDFFGRPEGRQVLDAYRLGFGSRRNMSSRLMYDALVGGDVDVITAYSSDGQIAAFDLVTLRDPKRALPPYDALLLVSPQAFERPQLVRRLRMLVNQIGDKAMRRANKAVDLDQQSVRAASEDLYCETLAATDQPCPAGVKGVQQDL